MNTQPEALVVASDLESQSDKVNGTVKYSTAKKAATLLRTQHADIERKDALLRQAFQVILLYIEIDREVNELYAAIKQELAK